MEDNNTISLSPPYKSPRCERSANMQQFLLIMLLNANHGVKTLESSKILLSS